MSRLVEVELARDGLEVTLKLGAVVEQECWAARRLVKKS